MVAALVLLVATGMDVVCGWQPMPDGSASYECVVQLEPELVNALQRGDAIPISVEVPAHVQPVSRIRITVGRGPVVQQQLAAQSPNRTEPEGKKSRTGLVETQFTTPNVAGNRYANQQAMSQPVLPPEDTISNAQNAFARSLQNGGRAIQDAMAQVSDDVLPPDAGSRLSSAVERTGQPLGNELRNVADTTRENFQQLVTGRGANARQPSASTAGSEEQIFPPGAGNDQEILPRQATTPNGRRVDQPISSSDVGRWPQNSQPNQNDNRSSNQASVTPPQNPASPWMTNDQGTTAGQGTPPNDVSDTSPGGRYAPTFGSDRTDVVPPGRRYASQTDPPRNNNSQTRVADNRGLADEDAQNDVESNANQGLGFPPFSPTLGNDRAESITNPRSQTRSQSSVPEIRRGMLDEPVDGELTGKQNQPPQTTTTTPSTASREQTPAATDFGWNTPPQTRAQQPNLQTASTPAGSGNVFPLLLSWVLLSGSGAGNFYLLWSYLDVRNKYRDLVYDASHKISRRHADRAG